MLFRPPAPPSTHSRSGPIGGPRPVARVSIAVLFVTCLAAQAVGADDSPAEPSANLEAPMRSFLDNHCVGCHDAGSKKGGLDLDTTAFEPGEPVSFARWVKVLDRVNAGEMPPSKSPRPDAKELTSFSKSLARALTAAHRERVARDGRAGRRRLNRHEYENTLRDLLSAPWLQVKEMLPEDGVAHRFNKVGEALDVSHVQMARYLIAADYSLREAMANRVDRPPSKTVRYYAREQPSFTRHFKYSVFNTAPERATFPTLGSSAQAEVRVGKEPLTVGPSDPKRREQEGVGLVCSAVRAHRADVQQVPGTDHGSLPAPVQRPLGLGRAERVQRGRVRRERRPEKVVYPELRRRLRRSEIRADHHLFRGSAAPAPEARLVRRHPRGRRP